MDMLQKRLGKALGTKHQFQAAFDSNKGDFSSIGKVDSKDENIKNIENSKAKLAQQEEHLKSIRDNIKQAGDSIQQGISQEKLREIERRERENESQRSAADQEVKDHINNLQKDKRQKKTVNEQLEAEVQRNQSTLKSQEDEFKALDLKQQADLKSRDDSFKEESKVKEDLILSLLDQLNKLNNQIKDDKRKQEELEEKFAGLENERSKLAAELGRLDQLLGEKDDLDDTDLALQRLKDNAADLKAQMAALDEQNRILDREIKDQKELNDKEQKKLDALKKLYKELSADKFDLAALQKQLADLLDREKNLFDNNMKLITNLKELDSNDSSFNKRQSELESMVNLLVDQNYLERKSRVLEKLIRELEDRLREKQSMTNEILRKLQRMEDLIRNPEESKAFGVDALKVKVEQLLEDIVKLRKDKDVVRGQKAKVEAGVVNKDIKEVNEESIGKCLAGLRELEQEIDVVIQRENDVLVVDKLKKTFTDIEKEVAAAFYKKCNATKDKQFLRQKQLTKKLKVIVEKAVEIEETILPDVSKIADDEDEIEILKSKITLLKDVKRTASDIAQINIEETLVVQLNRVNLRKEEPYELIEYFKDLTDLELEVDGLEKEVNQLEKRLYDFEHNLKAFEVELKQDFYDDSVQEVGEQVEKVAILDKQLKELQEGVAQIQESIKQAQSSSTHNPSQPQINQLQDALDSLVTMQKQAERDKKTLENSGKVLKGDLDNVNLAKINSTALVRFDDEIVKQKEQVVVQEKVIAEALDQMKKLRDNAEHIAFKKKADKRQDCKLKLKKFSDDLDDLDRLLREIQGILEMLQKDTAYLKVTEGSPVKNKAAPQAGDKEKDQDVAKQYRELEKQQDLYNKVKGERDSLRSSWEAYQKQFDSMTLENSGLTDYEKLHDRMEKELADTLVKLITSAKQQLDVDLKALRDQIEFIVEKYKQKRALLLDCRKEEKDKEREVQKAESQLGSMKLRVAQMERELLNQQSMNFKTNPEKKAISDALIAGVQKNKRIVHDKLTETEGQKDYLAKVVTDLNLLGNKIVTLDDLKRIYKQLIDMEKLQGFKELQDELLEQEQAVEQYIKDLLGGSQYECERKLKEAEALLDKLAKKVLELNNGMNDFEMDIKKGIQMNPDDGDILKEGKKLSDENGTDRKQLKEIEDQKSLIKKALNNIRASTAAGGGDANKLSASEYEDFIVQIEGEVAKTEKHLDEHAKLEEKLAHRIEEWNKQLLKSGTKDAIIEDIDRGLKENIDQLAELDVKLKDIDKLLRGFEEVTKAMKGNPDYELRQASVLKLIEQTAENRKQAVEMEKTRKKIQDQVDKAKILKDRGLKKLTTEELQNLTKQCEENGEELAKLNKLSDSVLKELQKRRQKLADADIFDNFKLRYDELKEIDAKNTAIEKDLQVLEVIIVEANKITPANASATNAQLKQLKADIAKSIAEKAQFKKRLEDLQERIKAKDLNKEDPYTFTPLINELRDLGLLLAKKDLELQKVAQNVKFLKNKFGGVDVEKKFDEFRLQAEDQKKRLAALLEDMEVLKELNEEFDGYTSDGQEEDFIERLGIDLRELTSKHKIATEEGESVADKIEIALKNIQRRKDKGGDQDLTGKEIEERATMVAQIEEQASHNQKLVDEIDNKVNKNKKVFMAMQGKQKLKRRQQEVSELNKKLETFESQLNEVEADMKAEFNKIKLGDEKGEKLHETLAALLKDIDKAKVDYATAGQDLLRIDQDVNDLSLSTKLHQFELLKGNIRVKKQILKCLEDTKAIRSLYIQLKAKYDISKPVKSTYKAAKGDELDIMLGNWINTHGIPVPIKRISNGYYMFGTKKIYAKMINGNLVIRVGGGYMGIEEFMFYYGAQELNKMLANEGVEGEEEIDLDEAADGSRKGDLIKHNQDGKSIIGIAQMKKRLSPRAASPTANRKSPRQGSPRQVTATGKAPLKK